MNRLAQKLFFVVRVRYLRQLTSVFNKFWMRLQGMKIGKGTCIRSFHSTWPHQVSIGDFCIVEHDVYFKYDGVWGPGPSIFLGRNTFIGVGVEFNIRNRISIGNDCLIASGCKFIDHDHSTKVDQIIRLQLDNDAPITIGNNVWFGFNAIVLKGVNIDNGAVVAAGAVVNKSIGANEIWAGVPARRIGYRR